MNPGAVDERTIVEQEELVEIPSMPRPGEPEIEAKPIPNLPNDYDGVVSEGALTISDGMERVQSDRPAPSDDRQEYIFERGSVRSIGKGDVSEAIVSVPVSDDGTRLNADELPLNKPQIVDGLEVTAEQTPQVLPRAEVERQRADQAADARDRSEERRAEKVAGIEGRLSRLKHSLGIAEASGAIKQIEDRMR